MPLPQYRAVLVFSGVLHTGHLADKVSDTESISSRVNAALLVLQYHISAPFPFHSFPKYVLEDDHPVYCTLSFNRRNISRRCSPCVSIAMKLLFHEKRPC